MMNKIYAIFLLLISTIFLYAQERYNTSVYEGNRAFDREDYDLASSKYMEAVKMNEKDFVANFNLGNSLYKNKKYQDAVSQYKKAELLAKNNYDKVASNYNLGNAYMKMGYPKMASEYYKKALKQDPHNEKIRKNYEIAKRQNDQQNKDNKNQQQDKEQEQKENSKNPKQNQPKEENTQNKNPSGENQSQNGVGEGKAPKEGKNPADKMPKDLQDALLDRIKSREQETARKILNKNAFSAPQSKEKDW